MNWNEYTNALARYDERLQEAQHHRIVQSILNEQRPTVFYAPALARVGRWLIAWGWRLRARYGEVEFHTDMQHDWTR